MVVNYNVVKNAAWHVVSCFVYTLISLKFKKGWNCSVEPRVSAHYTHCICRYSSMKAICIAFVMTFFSVFDVPVFWPILLLYWVLLFVLTMKRQLRNMIKYKYVPFDFGKQVNIIHDFFLTLSWVPFWFILRSSYISSCFACYSTQRYGEKGITSSEKLSNPRD